MNTTASPPAAARRTSAIAWLLAIVLLPLAAWAGWQAWQADQARRMADEAGRRQRDAALEARLDALLRSQRAQARRLQQAVATNQVLRDEVLGLGQRAALLEDSVRRLADPARAPTQALRLDEVELLLVQGGQRLALAGDLDGARRAYALAAHVLDRIATPDMLDLRQVLVQERGQLDAVPADPRAAAAAALDAVAATLDGLPVEPDADAPQLPWWRRVAARIVDIRPSTAAAPLLPAADREAGLAALEVELSLARASLERRDEAGFRRALSRMDGQVLRLWPPSPAREALRGRVRGLQRRSLALDIPTLGTTLEQLRRLRDAR